MLSFKKIALAATLVCACAAGSPAIGAANAGTLDQNQPNFDDVADITSTDSFAQTFTAGITGQLDAVELNLRKSTGPAPNGPLSVEIRDASGGPGGTILGSAVVPASSVPATDSFVQIGIAANVTAGIQYSIVARGILLTAGFYAWNLSRINPYPPGDAFVGPSSGAGPWSTNNFEGADLAFRTYVVPAAVSNSNPATTTQSQATGQRAAALQKCKKKKSKKARKRCRRRANTLPI